MIILVYSGHTAKMIGVIPNIDSLQSTIQQLGLEKITEGLYSDGEGNTYILEETREIYTKEDLQNVNSKNEEVAALAFENPDQPTNVSDDTLEWKPQDPFPGTR